VATVKMVILLISRLGRQNGRGTCVYTVNNILYVYTAYPHQRQVEKKKWTFSDTVYVYAATTIEESAGKRAGGGGEDSS
jgi:hypothetical protein